MWFVHAPCAITDIRKQDGKLTVDVAGWKSVPVNDPISGMDKQPKQILANGTPVTNATFDAELKLLVIPIHGKTTIEIEP